MRLYNTLQTKEFRKQLRKNLTPQEKKLWNLLRNRKLLNLKFFRQYSIGPFTLDFYCPWLRLAIEVDGGQHNEQNQHKYDVERSKGLESLSIKVLRFWNNEVDENIAGVFENVYQNAKQLLENSPRPLFKKERESVA